MSIFSIPKYFPQQKFFLYQSKYYESKLLLISNLLLGEKTLRACAPDSDSFLANSPADSGRNSGGNHWDALRASRILASKKPISSLLVPEVGLEPTRPCGHNILSVARIPIPPLRQCGKFIFILTKNQFSIFTAISLKA